MKLNYKRIFLIGLGFFTVTLAWALYNSYVPVFLENIVSSSTLIGFIMTVDNIFGIIFQPFFGRKSDRSKHRWGRRMPFLVIGIPLSAIFFSLIPFHTGIITLMLSVIGVNIFMSVYRVPVVALMPDVTPPQLRSEANGIINFMGGLGAVLALYVGGMLFNLDESYPFFMVSILMIFVLLLLFFFFKEPANPHHAGDTEGKIRFKFIDIKRPKRSLVLRKPSLLYILLAIFFWFLGYNAIEAFFTLYCIEAFDIMAGDAAQMMAIFAAAFLISAIPAGFIGEKMGRKLAIQIGLILILAAFIFIAIFPSLALIRIMFIASGISWALININSYPSVVQMAPEGQVGRYTGFYYAFGFGASIISPIFFGMISDITGNYNILFIYTAVTFLLAFLFLIPAKGFDSKPHKT